MSGGGAVANIIRFGDETGLRQKIAIAESLGSLVGRDEQVFAPAGAFKPAFAAQRLNNVVDCLGAGAEQLKCLHAQCPLGRAH
jgi:hypothetical protein